MIKTFEESKNSVRIFIVVICAMHAILVDIVRIASLLSYGEPSSSAAAALINQNAGRLKLSS
jgi:hypothetical protein